MSVTFAPALRACCVAVILGLATARAAEPPASPLIGATREQVLSRYGEPKSQLSAGNRVVYFYPREKITLRDDVVIEVEEIGAEPARRPPGETPPPTAQNPTASSPGGTSEGQPKNAPSASAPQPAPSGTAPSSAPSTSPKFEIKLVIPPSGKDAKDARPATPSTTVPATPPNSSTSPAAPSTSIEPGKAKVPTPTTTESPVSPETVVPDTTAADAKAKALADKKAKERQVKAEKDKKEKAIRDARRRLDEAADADVSTDLISGRMYLLAAIIVVGGAGFLIWRYRQRQLELAATSVSNTPLTTPPITGAAGSSGNVFTPELLEKLEWRRFEEVVAAYYDKTGVVALRTKTGPDTPVHIKISWKGESRPFAYVQCIVHPTGLIEGKPLQDLQAALASDNIRRGYVVTTGKFSVGARDLAEEKHITLLPGDIFVEKLNALPASARSEIMQALRGAGGAGSAD